MFKNCQSARRNFCNIRVGKSEMCDDEKCRKQKAACLWFIRSQAYVCIMGTIFPLCIVIGNLPGATSNDVVELPP